MILAIELIVRPEGAVQLEVRPEAGSSLPLYYDLLNVVIPNITVIKNAPYSVTVVVGEGLTVDSAIVTMNNIDISSSSWNAATKTITISQPDAPILITLSAVVTPDTIQLSDVYSTYQTSTADVVDAINTSDANAVSFIVLTDTHGSANGQKSQNICRYILKNSHASKLFWLGDISNINWSLTEYQTFAQPLLNCAEKVYPTLGNHEYFGGNASQIQTIYTDFLDGKTYLNGSLTDFYYYMDDPSHKVRYIVINTSSGVTNLVSSAELTWLESAVQMPSSDWGAIVFGHFPLQRNGVTETSENVSNQRYQVRDILLGTNGTIISYICGHTHEDINSIIDYSFYQQILDNDSESAQAISIFNVNLDTKEVYIYRIGHGSDINYDYDDLPARVDYTITNTLTGCTSSSSEDSILGGRPYTATLTPLENYNLDTGTVVIMMGGVDITSTAYNTSTHAISISSVTGNLSITATATYVAPLVEFTADWFSKADTKQLNFPADMGNVDSEFPDYFAVIATNGTTEFPVGFRSNSAAYYGSRTSGWTSKYWNLINSTGSEGTVAFTSTTLPVVTVDGKNYVYHTFTRADHNAAWAARVAAIAGGQIATTGKIVVNMKTASASSDIWVLAENVTADNIADIVRRLPSHS